MYKCPVWEPWGIRRCKWRPHPKSRVSSFKIDESPTLDVRENGSGYSPLRKRRLWKRRRKILFCILLMSVGQKKSHFTTRKEFSRVYRISFFKDMSMPFSFHKFHISISKNRKNYVRCNNTAIATVANLDFLDFLEIQRSFLEKIAKKIANIFF